MTTPPPVRPRLVRFNRTANRDAAALRELRYVMPGLYATFAKMARGIIHDIKAGRVRVATNIDKPVIDLGTDGDAA